MLSESGRINGQVPIIMQPSRFYSRGTKELIRWIEQYGIDPGQIGWLQSEELRAILERIAELYEGISGKESQLHRRFGRDFNCL